MNALNETVVGQMAKAVETCNSNDSANTIVLDGAGKAFVAGADVKFFVDKIRQMQFLISMILQKRVKICSTLLRTQVKPRLR